MKIAVAGVGYVGLSLATLLSRHHKVYAFDISEDKVNMINRREAPLKDNLIEEYFKTRELDLTATTDYKEAFSKARYIIISTPTNYDSNKNTFDTSSIEDIIEKILLLNEEPTIVIKSTIPIGYVKSIRKKFNYENIIFSPEFLREGSALLDNLHPSRIIVGSKSKEAKEFATILADASLEDNVMIKFMESTEAEAVKLFANAYLALRVAYFNELDTYAELNNLNSEDIIDGVCLDSRIGTHYNNPSFGYGGYCFPKDTKQLLANFKDVPQSIVNAIVTSNVIRKQYIADTIINKKPKTVGIYRLTMKSNSDNFRFSSIHDIIDILKHNNINIIIYEPTINTFDNYKVINEINNFIAESDIILANRYDSILDVAKDKVYTRDIYNNN